MPAVIDALNQIEQAARDLRTAEEASKRLTAARTKLVLGKDAKSAFFATVALRLRPEPATDIDTAATDGKRLRYNPAFMAGLTLPEAIGLLAHEVLHVTNAHHARMGQRDLERWNIACDLAINPIVAECGLTLPKGGLHPGQGKYAHLAPGKSAEEYYADLQQAASDQPQQGSSQPGQGEPGEEGDPDPGKCGGVETPPDGSESALRAAEAEAKILANQAEQAAKQRGDLPGGLGRNVAEILTPKADWRAILREFVSRASKNDYAWNRPNRRFIAQGLYLPGLHSEELGEVALAIDTSGSIDAETLARFAAELQGILESYDCSLTIYYHHSSVYRVDTWRSVDGPLVIGETQSGGTSHLPVFQAIAERDPPVVLVALTDLYSDFPADAPEYPVLWACVGNDQRGPFGQTVRID